MKVALDPQDWSWWFRLKLLRVTDGDTVVGLLDQGLAQYTQSRIRLSGIDAPESRSSDELERTAGARSKAALMEKLGPYITKNGDDSLDFDSSVLIFNSMKFEKYGRLLGTLWIPGEDRSVNQWLLDEGHAVAYGGS